MPAPQPAPQLRTRLAAAWLLAACTARPARAYWHPSLCAGHEEALCAAPWSRGREGPHLHTWAPHADRCLSAHEGGAAAAGGALRLGACDVGDTRQHFVAAAGSLGPLQLDSAAARKCVGVAQNGTTGLLDLALADCASGSAAQTFAFPERGLGPVRWASKPELCLSVAAGATAVGTPIELVPCDSGESQQFGTTRASAGSAFVGVNLGGWLILEDWMWASEMHSQNATDEHSLIASYGGPSDQRAQDLMHKHWDSFLRPEHLDTLRRFGVTHVRIPLGYWLFDEIYHVDDGFVGGQEQYLVRALQWLKQRNMKAVLDLHASPGGQARFEGFTGHRQDCNFYKNQTHYRRGKLAADALAQRIVQYEANSTTSDVVIGIQLLNEPTHAFWETSPGIKEYYEDMVPSVRRLLPADRYMIMLSFMDSPHKRTAEWLGEMRQRDPTNYAGVVYDPHVYHSFGDNTAPWSPDEDICKTCCRDTHILQPMWSLDIPVVIGEYSLSTGFAGWSEANFPRNHLENQLSLFNTTRGVVGSFAWNFRVMLAPTNKEMYMEWSLLDLIEHGHLDGDGGYRFEVGALCPMLGAGRLEQDCPAYESPKVGWNTHCVFRSAAAIEEAAGGGNETALEATTARAGPRDRALQANSAGNGGEVISASATRVSAAALPLALLLPWLAWQVAAGGASSSRGGPAPTQVL